MLKLLLRTNSINLCITKGICTRFYKLMFVFKGYKGITS